MSSGASTEGCARETAEQVLRNLVERKRADADRLESLAEHLEKSWPIIKGSHAEEALWELAIRCRP